MNDAVITCPKCQTLIPLTEVMRDQLTRDIRASIQQELNAERDALQAQREELANQAGELEVAQKSIDAQVSAKVADVRRLLAEKEAALLERQNKIDEEVSSKVAADRKLLAEENKRLLAKREQLEEEINKRLSAERLTLTQKLRSEVEQQYTVEMSTRDAQIVNLAGRLKEATGKEIALLNQKKELERQQETLQLEIARKLDEERAIIRKETLEQAGEQHDLKLKERDQVISQLHDQIGDMKRKLEQGSQQLQGEVMELELETLLAELFPHDLIEPVGKGIRGADVLHTVHDNAGRACGRILWESKRTKSWQATWLPKLRQDQRDAKADCCAIVSTVLPDGVQALGEIDGVWVSSWRCIAGLAAALRAGIITTAHARLALEGQQGKMEQVYNYLSGQQFRQRVQGIVESFTRMQTDLIAEKKAMQSHWSRREKQLEQALVNTAGLYGDLHGIIGGQLQKIEGMDLDALGDDQPPQLTAAASHP